MLTFFRWRCLGRDLASSPNDCNKGKDKGNAF